MSFSLRRRPRPDRSEREPRPVARPRSRRANRVIVLRAIGQIPAFVRLLVGLFRDRKVARIDKMMVVGALAYLAMPADFLADFVPFLGLVDDVFLLTTTIRRLIRNAGYRRALRYWKGDPEDLRSLRVTEIIIAARMLLPRSVRRKLGR